MKKLEPLKSSELKIINQKKLVSNHMMKCVVLGTQIKKEKSVESI
jgi:hypothetical protein